MSQIGYRALVSAAEGVAAAKRQAPSSASHRWLGRGVLTLAVLAAGVWAIRHFELLKSFVDWVTLVGTIVTFAGLVIAIQQIQDARRAAEHAETAANRAESAAKNVRASLVLATTIADCVVALAMMDEIRKHHRAHDWAPLPDLYSTLRRRLSSIRSENDNLSEDQSLALQSAMGQFATMEKTIERVIADGTKAKKPNIPNLNSIVGEQIDKVHAILTELQRSIRKQDHG